MDNNGPQVPVTGTVTLPEQPEPIPEPQESSTALILKIGDVQRELDQLKVDRSTDRALIQSLQTELETLRTLAATAPEPEVEVSNVGPVSLELPEPPEPLPPAQPLDDQDGSGVPTNQEPLPEEPKAHWAHRWL